MKYFYINYGSDKENVIDSNRFGKIDNICLFIDKEYGREELL